MQCPPMVTGMATPRARAVPSVLTDVLAVHGLAPVAHAMTATGP
jgi:hypothetical protein